MSNEAAINTGGFVKNEFKPVEPSDYLLRMKNFTVKDTKDGTGAYVDAAFEIARGLTDDDGAKGRLIFHKFHIKNKNPRAVQIGEEQLGKYLKAVGLAEGYAGKDTDILNDYLEMPFIGRVGIEKGTNGYKDRNKVTSFKSR